MALVLGAALSALGLPVGSAAAASANRPATTTIQEELGLGSSVPQLPPMCNFSWPTTAWPPKVDAVAKAHMLRGTDVPRGLAEHAAALASNTPNLDQLAVGFPRAAFAEMTYATRATSGESIDEMIGRLPTQAAAVTTYRHARDVVFGSCQRYWGDESPDQANYALANQGPDVFAYRLLSGSSYNSTADVVVLGHRGRFVFDLSVGNFIEYPATGVAAYPTNAAVDAVLHAALTRLGH